MSDAQERYDEEYGRTRVSISGLSDVFITQKQHGEFATKMATELGDLKTMIAEQNGKMEKALGMFGSMRYFIVAILGVLTIDVVLRLLGLHG